MEADYDIIIGGDFNVILDPEFDGLGLKESVKIIEQIRLSFDLIDIWRVRNPFFVATNKSSDSTTFRFLANFK